MPNTPAAPTAICFDLDDTLIDDLAASSTGLRAVMERLGHPDFGAARSLWDVQTEISFGSYLRGRLSLEQQRRERIRALAVQAGHADIADQHCDDLYRLYLDAHRSAWQLFPDTIPSLNTLASAGYRLAVVTNGIEALQHAKLQALELTPYFHAVVCADTAGTGKPDPRIFHTAAQRLGVDPTSCWHVGDQIQADGVGAVAARMHPVMVDRRGQQRFESVSTITSLDDLLRMVGLPSAVPAAGPL
ncbi:MULTISPECIES: HAD family hydrolase [Nocardiopsis]|uniref:Haloacid dehalogenase n=1 Tax=Nocardiopsis sinuspersici TaxID=501010 RepID=A0A1V3C0M7_9ACTN|nr:MULTISPECIES: HAD family hydrolase [Nocardiopsis]NYH55386.1 putative hydrolase of the HAD superfamily [Nocardiopsis sinuspersici]OOC54029.1 haloacid dehalogenase [Nocardiopsis sinuspersici]